MGKSRTKWLLVVLALLIVAGIVEYTIGGGWVTVRREIKRRWLAQRLAATGMTNWSLPDPIGPEDAKVKILAILNRQNPCHKEFADGMVKFFSEYADRVRVEFLDANTEETMKVLEGYPIACEMALLLNGLNSIKVPWVDHPVVLQGVTGVEGVPMNPLKRVIEWALTDEGLKSLEQQRKEFEAERKKRAKKQREMRQRALEEAAARASGEKPGPKPKPAEKAEPKARPSPAKGAEPATKPAPQQPPAQPAGG